ncbi:MAG: SDR family oxidoreductase [Gammaproteobacteria bacterium]
MRVLVTGTQGYIGSLLAPLLVREGFDVTGLDTGFYRDGWLYTAPTERPVSPTTWCRDLRTITSADLKGFDAIAHLAELSNDPLGESNPEVTFEINHRGSVALAQAARDAGLSRFVYASSCSVYGVGDGGFMTEESPVNPQTAYAHCKVRVERDVGALARPGFSPTFLRNATAFGASPRMRFDIVLNNLSGLAWTTRRIAMTSDGTPWRPLVHALDISQAVVCALRAPADAVHNQIFNVGNDAQNYRVREIAEIVADVFPTCTLEVGKESADNRSYRVSFAKISRHLPDFQCRWDARQGAVQLRSVFERIAMDQGVFEFRAFTRLKQIQYLLGTCQIDDHYYWQT